MITYLLQDKLFLLTGLLARVSVIWGDFSWHYVNWEVIFTLFGLMLLLTLFEASHSLFNLTLFGMRRASSTRMLTLVIISFAFLFR